MTPRKFTPEFKKRVVLEFEAGERKSADICREFQISDSLLRRWVTQYREHADKAWRREDPRAPQLVEAEVRPDSYGALECREGEGFLPAELPVTGLEPADARPTAQSAPVALSDLMCRLPQLMCGTAAAEALRFRHGQGCPVWYE